MSNEVVIQPEGTISNGYLQLPVNQYQFNEFIRGLLGRPQEIENQFNGSFTIKIEDLVQIYNLLQQRIQQQNRGTLAQFSAKVFFDDDTSVLLNGIDDLTSYRELRRVVSVGVLLSWTYVIHFPDKAAPEKQEIEVLIAVKPKWDSKERVGAIVPFVIHYVKARGRIELTIRHTERSWGVDIESLLSTALSNLLDNRRSLARWVLRRSASVTWLLVSFVLIAVGYGSIKASQAYSHVLLGSVSKALDGSHGNLTAKIDVLARYVAEGQWIQFYNVLTLSTLAGIVGGAVLCSVTYTLMEDIVAEPAFICLTRESESMRERILRKNRTGWINVLISMIFNVACGVMASYVFGVFTGPKI